MTIKKIMCCCTSGIVSSLMIRTNTEKILRKYGAVGIEISHAAYEDVTGKEADLYIFGGDLEEYTDNFEHAILLKNMVSMPELEMKLKKELEL